MKTIKTNKKEIVDNLLNDKRFQSIVEKDTGTPVKCSVNWDSGKITISGPKQSRVILIDDVVDSYKRVLRDSLT